jgi:dethiobiotin synthetase
LLEVTGILEQNVNMINLNPDGYFISASDTDAGKTYIACQLIKQLNKFPLKVVTRKPAESGCRSDDNDNRLPADAIALQTANNNKESLDVICPHRFQAALAPHRAAGLEGKSLSIKQLIDASLNQSEGSCLIVEGAGGFYSPIADDGLNANIATALQLPVILVIDDRVGAVNQALLTVAAVEQQHLTVAAVIFNRTHADHESGMQNAEDFSRFNSAPVFECGFEQALANIFKQSIVKQA